MGARLELIDRLKYLDTAAALPVLIDAGIAPSEHNSVANLLRKGMSIVGFNILEDFIKNKCYESLDLLSASGIQYLNLPVMLQELAIVEALKSLNFQANILKKDGKDYMSVIRQEAKKIASATLSPYSLSKYTLLSSGSNVSANEVVDFLKAFGIKGGWLQLKGVSDAIGGGIPDLASAFHNASERRHSSAHSASFLYNTSWLSNLKSEVLAICAAVDILISVRCRQAMRSPHLPLESHDINGDLNFRFLELHGTIYKETKSIGGPSRKNWTVLDSAIAHHEPLLSGRKEFLIILDPRRRIANWLT
jgi:hypothetical protein